MSKRDERKSVPMESSSHDLNDYGFSTELRVRLSETDAVGIVFFGSFSIYFDVGRMDYLQHLALNRMDGAVRDLIPGAVVYQSTRFHSPARYNDILILHVRIAEIGDTSYTFNILVTNKRTRLIVASGLLSLVWLDENFVPVRIPDAFREAVRAFEGSTLSERS
jgi:acyl-CoA thioester hydrolase